MVDPQVYLTFSGLLFTIGLLGVLIRRNAIIVLVGVELMLNAANLNFVAFSQMRETANRMAGTMFAMFSIGIAAAEAAVGLALILMIYRHYKTTDLEKINRLKG
jgi:NADH:ubiquinone oxidoreductase subunit K